MFSGGIDTTMLARRNFLKSCLRRNVFIVHPQLLVVVFDFPKLIQFWNVSDCLHYILTATN